MSDEPANPPSSRSSLRIVILGDLHTYRLRVKPWELLGKSLAGQMNLWLNRRRRFDPSLIEPTIERAVTLKPDLVLLSGDLTTTARPGEFADISASLRPLLNLAPAVLVPGNHDVYTFTAARRNRIANTFPEAVPGTFPYARPLIGAWRLLAINSAIPRLFDSRGRIGGRQAQHVEAVLRDTPERHGLIVLCHYPFGKPPELGPMKRGHRLLDETRWRDALGMGGRSRVMLIHGHVHCPWLWKPPNMPSVLDVNAGAPTMVSGHSAVSAGAGEGRKHVWPRGQGFWEIALPADAAASIQFTHHVMDGGAVPYCSGLDDQSWHQQEQAGMDSKWIARRLTVALGKEAASTGGSGGASRLGASASNASRSLESASLIAKPPAPAPP